MGMKTSNKGLHSFFIVLEGLIKACIPVTSRAIGGGGANIGLIMYSSRDAFTEY